MAISISAQVLEWQDGNHDPGAQGYGGAVGARRGSQSKPFIQFRFISVDGTSFAMQMAMNGKSFGFFPEVYGSDLTTQVGCYFFP